MSLFDDNQIFITRKGPTDASQLKLSNYIGLYFAEYRCPLSRYLTPLLAETYSLLNDKTKNIEIVFISNDQNQEEYDKNLTDMPWLALSFDSDIRQHKIDEYKIVGMPRLIIISNSGRIISSMEQNEIEENIYDPWRIYNRWMKINSFIPGMNYDMKNSANSLMYVMDKDELTEFKCNICSTVFPEYQPRFQCENQEDDYNFNYENEKENENKKILEKTCCQCFIEDEVLIDN